MEGQQTPVTQPNAPQPPAAVPNKGYLKWAAVGVAALIAIGLIIFTIYLFASNGSGLSSSSSSNAQSTAPKAEVKALTIYDWWTSPSESAAFNALKGVFTTNYPDVAVVAAPVTGGAGFQMITTIRSLMAAGEGPDAFQMHAAYEAEPYFQAGMLSPVDYIWSSSGLASATPKVIQDMNKFNGRYYSVPVDLHRSNIVWYNKALLDKNGIDSSTLTTWDAFFAAADKLRANGVQYPIQQAQSWTVAQTFETIIAGSDIGFYEDWVNGKVTSATDPRMIAALTTLKRYLSYTNPDSSTLPWDQAVDRIIKGQGAFNLMGDWANGEFKLVGMKYGKDYGMFPLPGTQGMYGLVVDTFQHPKDLTHPKSADEWLLTVASQAGQDAFNPIKGSISVRSDSDTTKYDAYQQAAISDFKSAKYLYPSVANGSGAPQAFTLKLNDIMASFVQDQNVSKTAADLASFTQSIISQYDRSWSLR